MPEYRLVALEDHAVAAKADGRRGLPVLGVTQVHRGVVLATVAAGFPAANDRKVDRAVVRSDIGLAEVAPWQQAPPA